MILYFRSMIIAATWVECPRKNGSPLAVNHHSIVNCFVAVSVPVSLCYKFALASATQNNIPEFLPWLETWRSWPWMKQMERKPPQDVDIISEDFVFCYLVLWKFQYIFTGEVVLAGNADCLVRRWGINLMILLNKALLIPYHRGSDSWRSLVIKLSLNWGLFYRTAMFTCERYFRMSQES
jgi:hypothetical protein